MPRKSQTGNDAHRCYRPEFPWTVYLVQSGALYKIGIAEDVRRRLQGLRSGSAVPVKRVAHAIVCCQEKAREVERALHEAHARSRRHGEWFNLDHVGVFRVTTHLKSPWINVRRRRRAAVNAMRKAERCDRLARSDTQTETDR
jgi:hypothetical protein